MKLILRALFAILAAVAVSSQAFADSTDWSHPSVSDTYSAWPGYVKDLARTAAKMDFSGDTNIPTGVIRYNASTSQIEKYNGTTWDALTVTNLLDGAVSTAAKLAADVVTSAKILDGTIVAADIANATITGGKIASATITGSNIASGTIASSNIASGTIAADRTGFAWTTNSPTVSNCGTSTINAVTNGFSGEYVQLGKLMTYSFSGGATLTVAGNCLGINLPVAISATQNGAVGTCQCKTTGGTVLKPCHMWGAAGASAVGIYSSDGTNFTTTSNLVYCTITYFTD